MSFNPDPSKKSQTVIFSRKSKRHTHPHLASTNNNVSQTFHQKHLGVILDFKLTFEDQLNNILARIYKCSMPITQTSKFITKDSANY